MTDATRAGTRIRILIDDGLSSRGQRSGVGQHSENVARHLNALASCDLLNLPIVASIPRYLRKWAYIGALNVPWRFNGYDVVHHMNHYVPALRGISRRVATIHDLVAVRYPETVSLAWRHYNRHALEKALERADALVTASHAVRDELLEFRPSIPPDRVHVCSSGVRDIFSALRPTEDDLAALGVKPFSYFLFVGDLSRRKNLLFLLESFAAAKRSHAVAQDTALLLVGKRGWGFHEFEHLIRDETGIRLMGYVGESALVGLYRYSKALVFPSVYEGFGSPIVEAMSQGCPIIISDIPSSRELDVAHHGQMLRFSLGDRNGLCAALEHADRSHESIRGGLSYGDLSPYSYAAVAKKHFDVYAEILR